MTNEVHNIDNIVVQDMNRQMNQQAPVQPAASVPEVSHGTSESVTEIAQNDVVTDLKQDSAENLQTQPENAQNNENKPEIEAAESKSPIDEYGNPIAPPKTYTEEEVQRMIRDRLSRGRHAEQPQQQQIQQESKDFKADPNSEESWETQLEAFVEKTIEKRQTKQAEQQWKQQEAAKQADFEARFTSGMAKYQDFHSVVSGKPVTDSMLLAARGLDNPAAFVYGAAKLHPQELDRISRISDPYSQAAEIGRLHEKMVKLNKQASSAPKPIESVKGDLSPKSNNMPSLEQRILEHARAKRK